MISIQFCEHCGAVKDAEPPTEVVQQLKKVGWELKRAEGKRPAAAEQKPAKKKNETREENGNGHHAEPEEAVTA